jgi:hypothetical protein
MTNFWEVGKMRTQIRCAKPHSCARLIIFYIYFTVVLSLDYRYSSYVVRAQ